MNILERLLRQEALVTRQLLLRCQTLARDQLDTPLGQGYGSLHETLIYLVQTVEMWTDLLQRQPVRLCPEPGDLAESIEGLIIRMDVIAIDSGREAVEQFALSSNQVGDDEGLSLAGTIALVVHRNQQRRTAIYQLLNTFTNSYELESYASVLSQA